MPTYAEVQGAISQAQPVYFHGGQNLPHGSKSGEAVAAVCDFSASGIPGSGYSIDTTVYTNRLQMKTVQTIFIDNSQNNGFVAVYNPVFNQTFALPAGYQGYFPILAPLISGAKFYVTSTGDQVATIQFLNALFPLASWAATVEPPSVGNPFAVSDIILDSTVSGGKVNARSVAAQVTAADGSGIIAAANTWQLLFAANANRQGWSLQNIDSTNLEALFYAFSNTPTIGASGSYSLAASASPAYPGGAYQGPQSNPIYVAAATVGHKFSAAQW